MIKHVARDVTGREIQQGDVVVNHINREMYHFERVEQTVFGLSVIVSSPELKHTKRFPPQALSVTIGIANDET